MNEPITRDAVWDEATGEVRLRLGGTEYVFPYPTFGQFRKAMELDERRAAADREGLAQARALAATEAAPDTEAGTVDPDLDLEVAVLLNRQMLDGRERCAQWWVDIAALFGVAEFPTVDELPTWISLFETVSKTVRHWLRFPFEDLGLRPESETTAVPESGAG